MYWCIVHPSIHIYFGTNVSNIAFKTGFPINGFTVKSHYFEESDYVLLSNKKIN